MKRIAKRRGDAGFTLIELLVVVLVIGVLSGIVVLAVSNSTADAKRKACLSNASALLTALDVYRNTTRVGTGASALLTGGSGAYPPIAATAASVTINGKTITAARFTSTELEVLVPTFIKSLPPITPTTGDNPETAVTAFVSTETPARAFVKVSGTACDTGDVGVGA